MICWNDGWFWTTRCGGCDAQGAGLLCDACCDAAHVRPGGVAEGVATVRSVALYDGPIGLALKRAKYGRNRHLLVELAELFAHLVIDADEPRPDVIVPVPSPWTRVAWRGFSSAALLAETLARRIDRPVVHALSMPRGPRQASLRGAARARNMRRRVRPRNPVEGHIWLVDDVVTTGATAEACTRELMGLAASRVDLATLCLATV